MDFAGKIAALQEVRKLAESHLTKNADLEDYHLIFQDSALSTID